jgi:hypothetical protein
MEKPLLASACSVMSAKNIDRFEDLVTNVTLLVEVGRIFSSHIGMPGRTPAEIRQELLRLQKRYYKQKPRNEKRFIGEGQEEGQAFILSCVSSVECHNVW